MTTVDIASRSGLELATLQEAIAQHEATLAQHEAERAELQKAVDSATLQSDPLQLATTKIRIGLLDKAILHLQNELAPLRAQARTQQEMYARHAARLSSARHVIAAARQYGLKDPRKKTVQLAAFVRDIESARAILQAAGETVDPIHFEL